MSTEMKRNLIGGAGIAALLTLFMALALWPLWSRGADASPAVREIVVITDGLTSGNTASRTGTRSTPPPIPTVAPSVPTARPRVSSNTVSRAVSSGSISHAPA